MKRLTLVLLTMLSVSVFSQNLTLSDFESGFIGKWGTNGNTATTPDEDHVNFSIVDNPSKTGINTSNKVAKFHRLKSGNWWALCWFDFSSSTITASLAQPKYLHISIYKPLASNVCVQLKDKMNDPTSNTGELISDKQTKINEWQDVVYKLTSSGTYLMIEVKPDFVSSPALAERLTNDIDIYIDNIFINSDPTPTGETPITPPEYKGNLPESFEGTNTLLDPSFYGERFGVFGQAAEATDIVVADNPAKKGINTTSKCAKFIRKTTGEWWAGAYVIPKNSIVVDENNKYFHIMLYRESDPAPLSLKLENTTNITNTGDIILQGNSSGTYDWVDYVFQIPQDKYGTYDKFAFMPDFVQTPLPSQRYFENALIYFDELEVNNNPLPRTSTITTVFNHISSKPLTAWYENNILKINLPAEETGLINVLNLSGQIISTNEVNAQQKLVSIPMDKSVKGVVLVRFISKSGNSFIAKVSL